jgi:metallophosphoesterase (TIGR00282 family)
MKILYIGDITSKLGRQTTAQVLPDLIRERQVDYVIAQGENVSHGKGLQANHARELMDVGVNFFTGGNHSLARPEYLADGSNVLRPANLIDAPGRGSAMMDTPFGKILIISLQGQIVGMDAGRVIHNPLETVDKVLEEHKHTKPAAIIVNFHGDFSSEKVVIGQYLDGRVSAVIGDHWHIPTADAQVLPGGTAHITDVGMVGALDSSLGVKTEVIVQRWQDPQAHVRNEMEEGGRRQFCAALIDVDGDGKARSIEAIRQILSA